MPKRATSHPETDENQSEAEMPDAQDDVILAAPTETISERSEPITVGPDRSLGLISAWDGLFYVFNARVEGPDGNSGFEITPEGLVAHNFTVAKQHEQYAEQILRDVNMVPHRPRLFPAIYWINGETPAPLSSKRLTIWMVTSFKNAVMPNSSRTPEYVRLAIAKLLRAPKTKGPKVNPFKNLDKLSVDAVTKSLNNEEIAKILEVLQQSLESQSTTEATHA